MNKKGVGLAPSEVVHFAALMFSGKPINWIYRHTKPAWGRRRGETEGETEGGNRVAGFGVSEM